MDGKLVDVVRARPERVRADGHHVAATLEEGAIRRGEDFVRIWCTEVQTGAN